jgi:hypothetical protein
VIFDYAITVPAGTTAAAPLVTQIKLTKGIVHKFELEFAAGCDYKVFACVKHGSHQVWPTNPGGSFCTDDYTISFEEYLEVEAGANEFQFVTWSPGTSYDHVLRLRIGLIESDTALFMLKVLKGLQKFLALMRIPL